MRFNLVMLSKAYLAAFGLINLSHLAPLLGFEASINMPSKNIFWWWHLILLLAYGVLPLAAALMNDERVCLTVTGASIAGISLEAFRIFMTAAELHYIFLSLNALATVLSLYLAVENVSLKIAAERFNLERSQF